MSRVWSLIASEERQYGPFVAGAVFFGLVVGFPLGFLLAHAAAQGSTLGGRWGPLVQVHGHLQLMGWVGLFVMGMGYRLVPRFTGVRVRPVALVPLTLALMVCGLALRAIAQPFAEEGVMAGLFVASAAMEATAVLMFAGSVLRCLVRRRRREFLYAPFFAAGGVWLAVASILNLLFVTAAAVDAGLMISPPRAGALTFLLLYGFAAMFIFAVSLRTFPVFFERRPAQRRITLAALALANGGIAAYAAALVWLSYDRSADVRLLQSGAFLVVGVAFLMVLGVLRVFAGTPHRLRAAARRSMTFVRFAYAWLLMGAGLQVFFATRALLDGRRPSHYETDAVRHFLGAGFVTGMIIGMAFLVLPPLAMRRAQVEPARIVGPVILALINGAAAARGAGSLVAEEANIENGFWTMSAAGVAAILAMAVFAVYLAWPSRPPEIPLAASSRSSPP